MPPTRQPAPAPVAVSDAPVSPLPPSGDMLISVDLGNRLSKFYARLPGGVIEAGITRSIYGVMSDANELALPPDGAVMVYNNQRIALGEDVYTYAPLRAENYIAGNRYFTAWYRTLFAGVLYKALYARVNMGQRVKAQVMSALPARIFKDKPSVKTYKAGLEGVFSFRTPSGKDFSVEVESPRAVLEGMGTYWNQIMNPDNQANAGAYTTGSVALVDFGSFSLDFGVVRNAASAAELADSNMTLGANNITQAVSAHVYSQTKIALLDDQIDMLMWGDAIDVSGWRVEIAAVRQQALEQLAERAAVQLKVWTSALNIHTVLLTGNIANVIKPLLNDPYLPVNRVIAGNCVASNAEGGLYWLLAAESRGK